MKGTKEEGFPGVLSLPVWGGRWPTWAQSPRGICSKTESSRAEALHCPLLAVCCNSRGAQSSVPSSTSPSPQRPSLIPPPSKLVPPLPNSPPHMPPSPYPSCETSEGSGRMASLGCHIESRRCVPKGACPLNPRVQCCIPWGRKNLRGS